MMRGMSAATDATWDDGRERWEVGATDEDGVEVLESLTQRTVAQVVSLPERATRDAALIAAAPEMLALLRELTQHIDSRGNRLLIGNAYKAMTAIEGIRALLKRLEGE